MRRLKLYTIIGMVVLGLCFSSRSLANEAKEAAAVAAATIWLNLVDERMYGDSWEAAAAYFKRAIARQKWEQMLTAVRNPLGRMVSRELISKTYSQSLPGAPDGEYVVIQFATSFENKKSAIETVTPMLDSDGEWRVSGYFIK
jgi:hypothetical protein